MLTPEERTRHPGVPSEVTLPPMAARVVSATHRPLGAASGDGDMTIDLHVQR